MHQEAYKRYKKKAKKKSTVSTGWVDYSKITSLRSLENEEVELEDQDDSFAARIMNGFDEWWKSNFEMSLLGEESVQESSSPLLNADLRSKDSILPGSLSEGNTDAMLWEFAKVEGDSDWLEWINEHIWTYVGLSAPLIGAINPLRAVLSGENMGMPMSEKDARMMEICKMVEYVFEYMIPLCDFSSGMIFIIPHFLFFSYE